VEHEQAHVPEHAGQEDDLGQELAERVGPVVEVLVVPQRHEHTEEHVDDPDDDGDLHLEGVQEDDLVGGHLPQGLEKPCFFKPSPVGFLFFFWFFFYIFAQKRVFRVFSVSRILLGASRR
jgi:hypothetical protein